MFVEVDDLRRRCASAVSHSDESFPCLIRSLEPESVFAVATYIRNIRKRDRCFQILEISFHLDLFW